MDAQSSELESRWLGRTINNKYVVQSVMGNGGMAVVYAVKHRNGKRFALKMLHRELSLNPSIRQRFVREGYVANRVEHEGSVAVIDDDITEDGSAFLVMELLHGVTLERLWEANNDRLTLECVLAISEQLLDVLAAAHVQNIVHRDLKPANIFLTRNGIIKILDFGIARLREGDGAKTETGTTLGTPLFMPPEQASGRSRDVDARTDLWSVGATMFSLLSGQYVHDGENAAQVLIAVATTPARSLGAVLPAAPAEIVSIVDGALAFHNEDRWESAVAMRAAILSAQQSLGMLVSREVLGQMVRATAPATSSADIQFTPTTTPGGSSGPVRTDSARTEPQTPIHGSDDVLSAFDSGPSAPPGLDATKRSAVAPEGASASSSGPRTELSDSSARALTSPTAAPPHRSSSALIGTILVATVIAAVGGLFAVRFATGSSSQTPSTTMAAPPAPAPTAVSAPLDPKGTAAEAASPSPASAQTTGPESPSTAASAPSLAVHAAAAQPKPGLRRPPQKNAKPASNPPAAAASSPTPAAPPAPAAAAPAAAPAPATSPASPVNGRKPQPTLDRTSPFGNN